MDLWKSVGTQPTRPVLLQSTSLNGVKKKQTKKKTTPQKNIQNPQKCGTSACLPLSYGHQYCISMTSFIYPEESKKMSAELYSQSTRWILLFALFPLFIHKQQHD